MEEGSVFRVIDVYLSDRGCPPLLQTTSFQNDLEDDEEEEVEEGCAFVGDESMQQQMRALGLPTRFSSAPRKTASQRRRRSSRRHEVTLSLDEQGSRKLCTAIDQVCNEQGSGKLCAAIDQVCAVQLDADKGPCALKCEANYGEGGDIVAPSRDHQESKSISLSLSDGHVEAVVLGDGAVDVCGVLALDVRVQPDALTIYELDAPQDSSGCLAHKGARSLDGGEVPNRGKESNLPGPVSTSHVHSLEVESMVSPCETNPCTEDPIIGSSRTHQERSKSDKPTSIVDYCGPNNEEASRLRCGVIDEGMFDLGCMNSEVGTMSHTRQPHAKGELISINGDWTKEEEICRITAAEDVAIAEPMLASTHAGLVTEEPFTISNSRAAAQDEQATTLSDSNSTAVGEGSIARADDILVKGAVEESRIEDSHFQSAEGSSWAACWDNHYGCYFFYNRETLESTWEPPKGFESYANASALEANNKAFQDDPARVTSNSEELVVEESKEGNKPCEDAFKSGTLLQRPSESEVEALPTESAVKEALKSSGNHIKSLQSNLAHGTDGTLRVKEGTVDCPEFALESSICDVIAYSASKSSIVQVDEATSKVFVPTRRARMADKWLVRLESQGSDISAAMGDLSFSILKYWAQRFHLFSKYDLGVKLDEEGWFSVTPEAIAKHQAARCQRGVIVDAFAGVGGNAIQFALADHYVIAIDNDPKKIEYARHNALVYGVADRIDFVLGDFFAVSSSMQADTVFLSPPWGGPDYLRYKVYDILTMLQPKDGISLLKVAQSIASNIIFFLPRNVDMNQLAEISRTLSSPCSCEVERNYLNGKLKAVTVYFGQFASKEGMCSGVSFEAAAGGNLKT